MIASLMLYGLVVAAIMGLAALAAERGLAALKWPRRMVWMLALVASLVLPAAMVSANRAQPAPQAATGRADFQGSAVTPVPDSRPLAIPALSLAIRQPTWPAEPNLDGILEAGWLASSLGILAIYAAGWVRLRRAAQQWTNARIDGAAVSVADRLGPAVVGFLKPGIVLPRWLLGAPSATRAMVVAHERAHIAARDPLLVLAALLLVAVAPWNLPLLWQLRRLRFAIEVDCDARVLGAGIAPSAYGAMLLAVGQRNVRTPMAAIALIEPASALERRIRVMTAGAYRRTRLLAVACVAAAAILVVASTQLNTPAFSQSARGAQMADADMKHYKSAEWNFALDIPTRWNSFPPNPTNSPNEVIRFQSHEDGNHVLIVFRQPYNRKDDLKAYAGKVQQVLAGNGFSNFVTSETTIGSKTVVTLDFDKMMDGRLWSCRHYFIVDGTILHILGFGTTDKDAMFPLYDRIAKSFVFAG
jgi:beta-lactamase regulating signal transducer with metallopeptidase domain